ncbi:DUF4760 domain-containing protein [Bradyrhizobium sp. USDA 4452]
MMFLQNESNCSANDQSGYHHEISSAGSNPRSVADDWGVRDGYDILIGWRTTSTAPAEGRISDRTSHDSTCCRHDSARCRYVSPGKIGKEDSRHRRIQATVDVWMKLREEMRLPDLTDRTLTPKFIEDEGKKAIAQLRKLELFSRTVNSGAHDLETLNAISGSWFLQQVEWITPYIELRRKKNEKPKLYKEIVDLGQSIRSIHDDD